MTEPAFVMAGMGLFLASTGLYIPIFYLPTYFAHYLHASSSLSFYSLSILNAASMLGRIMPGLLADRIGPIYTIIPVTAATVILAFAWIGIRNIGGMIAFACLYGFSSGAILSLPPSIVASMSPDLALVGTRMGMCFAFSSFGILIGNPVASTLLNLKDDVWWRMQLFTGAILTGGLLCFVAVALIQTPPFYIQLDGKELKPGNDEFQRLLQRGIPAAYKTRKYDIVSPRHNVRAYLEQEFSMETLEQIIGHLGFAGYMYPSRPLHTMQSLGRKLVITERMDMHLVLENASKRIYIKPVPEILLIPQFWTDYLSCPQNCPCPMTTPTINMGKLHQQLPRCPQRKLRMTALGLLYSYAALISYESDFHIAKNAHLLPSSVDWTQWQSLVYQLVTDSIYTRIHPRFLYGELLVVQLDLALMFTGRRLIPGFAGRWNQYSSLVQNNIAAIVTVAVFTGLILSAMQVGLASSRLASNGSFQAASYGFAVFCILGPLALFGLAAVAAAYGMVVNKFALNEADKNRVEHLQQPIPQ
ncbi:hypothetical protein NQ176_g9786 [Zarea fungicola]|uniref:Uncharacterized protein n=1 Tax=Zarea fungicola TaxID=93591 RepID=A0ACC1MJS1_9HYPO|nr:hypothetical protein NQ176_g9786 [Lecanicillium fungicola]